MHRAVFLHSALWLIATLLSAAEPPPLPRTPPHEPAEAADTFQVLHGFRMELLAAEPLVTDPVAIAYDEDGRAYVCEMNDYPYTDKARHKQNQENPSDQPIGKIRLLIDRDGDGRFEHSTVFAEGLSWPTGVACWKGGVFVAATPDLWYLKDSNGDGVADIREKVVTGFRKLNVQAVMNNLCWGLDNKLYGAGSGNGGELVRIDRPQTSPLTMSRQDFRFNPANAADTLELISGGARFGNSFDDWGNRFLCNIRNPAQHVVLPSQYLTRNPVLPVRSAINDVAEAGDRLPVYRISPVEPWRELRAQRWSGERDRLRPHSELVGAGVVTSSSGATVYRGTAYAQEFRGNIFTAEPAGNLLYRQTLAPDGVTFKARRVDGEREMVASRDVWFRPVNFVNAPDGTLHVCDMYREAIEHPWSVPDDLHALLDLESGRDRGRLWRLAPPGFKAPQPPRLSQARTTELVATLENRNAWWRETAQRLLYERQDRSAAGPLRALLNESREPLARLHALWTLE
ncbi:MAG: dehydrogenase, partial [Verrucomicrobiota bacterium]|nr:dehydrogenase [Verrucomicrobiota bacterium]